jgi:hypothetical protein
MTINTDIRLEEEQRLCFMEAIEASLKVEQRSQLFNWLQVQLYSILKHDIIIFGTKANNGDNYNCDYFTSSRYFTLEKFREAIQPKEGLVWRAFELWSKTGLPIFVTSEQHDSIQSDFELMSIDKSILEASELKSFTVYGSGIRSDDKSC